MVALLLAMQLAAAALLHDSLFFRVREESTDRVATIKRVSGGDLKTAIVFVSLICSIATLLLSFGLLAPGLASTRGRCALCRELVLLCKGDSWMCDSRAPKKSIFAWYEGTYRPALTDRAAFMGQLMAMFWLMMGSFTLVGSVAEIALPTPISLRSALGMQALLGRSPNAVMTPLGIGLLHTMDVTSAELFQLRQPSSSRRQLWIWASKLCHISPATLDNILNVWLHWSWRTVFWFIANAVELGETGCAITGSNQSESLCRSLPYLNLLLVAEFAIWAVAAGLLLRSRVMQVAIARAVPLLTVSLALPGVLLEFVLPAEVTSPPLVWATGLITGILLPAAAYIMLLWEDSFRMDALTRFLRYISHEVRVPANTAVLAVGEILHECNKAGELQYTLPELDAAMSSTVDMEEGRMGGVPGLEPPPEWPSPASGPAAGVTSSAKRSKTRKVSLTPLLLDESAHNRAKAATETGYQPTIQAAQNSRVKVNHFVDAPQRMIVGVHPSSEASVLTSLSGSSFADRSSVRSAKSSADGRSVMHPQGSVLTMNSLQLSSSSAHAQSLPNDGAGPGDSSTDDGSQSVTYHSGAPSAVTAPANGQVQCLSASMPEPAKGPSAVRLAKSAERTLPAVSFHASAEQLDAIPRLSGGEHALMPGVFSNTCNDSGQPVDDVSLPSEADSLLKAGSASALTVPSAPVPVEFGSFPISSQPSVKLQDAVSHVDVPAEAAVAAAMQPSRGDRRAEPQHSSGGGGVDSSDGISATRNAFFGPKGGSILAKISPRSPSSQPNFPVIHAAARDAHSSLQHMQELLDRTLDLARLEAGISALIATPFGLQHLWRAVKNHVSPAYRSAGVQLRMHGTLPDTQLQHLQLVGDSLRIRQTMVNILLNGSRYTPAGGYVMCRASVVPVDIFAHQGLDETADETEPRPIAAVFPTLATPDNTASSMGDSCMSGLKSSTGSDATIVTHTPVAGSLHRSNGNELAPGSIQPHDNATLAGAVSSSKSAAPATTRALVQWHSREDTVESIDDGRVARSRLPTKSSASDNPSVQPTALSAVSNLAHTNMETIARPWAVPGAACLLRIVIRDNGQGMSEFEQSSLFEAFARLHTGDEGTGLGLNIAKRAMQAHGGDVTVHSDGLNTGCTFTITALVHIGKPSDLHLGLSPGLDQRRASALSDMLNVQSIAPPLRQAPAGADMPTTPAGVTSSASWLPIGTSEELVAEPVRILVVDDDNSTRRIISRMLVRQSRVRAVATARDGVEAVEFVQRAIAIEKGEGTAVAGMPTSSSIWVPSHITLDNSMPRLSGIDAARQLRAAGYAGRIVGVTGNSLEAEREEFAEAGADLVLSKPVQRDALLAALWL